MYLDYTYEYGGHCNAKQLNLLHTNNAEIIKHQNSELSYTHNIMYNVNAPIHKTISSSTATGYSNFICDIYKTHITMYLHRNMHDSIILLLKPSLNDFSNATTMYTLYMIKHVFI